MKLRAIGIVALALFSCSLRAAETDEQTEARKVALDVAGAFTNDGFKIRDGHWTGTVGRDRAIIAVNLYAGNQYWFCAGATEKAKKLAVDLFDETGHEVASEHYDDVGKAAAGFSPTTSGQYYVALGVIEGEPATCCLLYSYK